MMWGREYPADLSGKDHAIGRRAGNWIRIIGLDDGRRPLDHRPQTEKWVKLPRYELVDISDFTQILCSVDRGFM